MLCQLGEHVFLVIRGLDGEKERICNMYNIYINMYVSIHMNKMKNCGKGKMVVWLFCKLPCCFTSLTSDGKVLLCTARYDRYMSRSNVYRYLRPALTHSPTLTLTYVYPHRSLPRSNTVDLNFTSTSPFNENKSQ